MLERHKKNKRVHKTTGTWNVLQKEVVRAESIHNFGV